MQRARIVHAMFATTVIFKGVDGILEVIGGAALLFVDPARLVQVVRVLTQHELSEDPRDLVAHYLFSSSQHLPDGVQSFAALYLLWHGAVKAGLVVALLLKRQWAFPAAMLAFLLFLLYQIYRYLHTHSAALLVLSVLDVIVIAFTWLEYRRLLAARAFAR